MATTPSPTPRASESPMAAGVRSLTSSAWITARSVTGSVPTMVASAVVPSSKLTESSPPSAATSTTWLLVRISPSSLRTTPEPDPDPAAPATLILTTDGSTVWATPSTESAGASEPVLSLAEPSAPSDVGSGLREEAAVAAGSGVEVTVGILADRVVAGGAEHPAADPEDQRAHQEAGGASTGRAAVPVGRRAWGCRSVSRPAGGTVVVRAGSGEASYGGRTSVSERPPPS